MRVGRNEIARSGIEVCKITTPASLDRYLLANLASVLEYYGPATSFSRFNRTKESRRASAYDNYVRLNHVQSVSPFQKVYSSLKRHPKTSDLYEVTYLPLSCARMGERGLGSLRPSPLSLPKEKGRNAAK